jgi:hypothetical protein
MSEKYLLYIDILGFSELVLRRGAVDDLYDAIDDLHVHESRPSFEAIAFSDTLLVYNAVEARTSTDRRFIVMIMCEFAQDLFYRLVGKDLYFRAYLTKGEFEHKHLSHLQSFYGEALIRAYRHEKTIECTGLFIDRQLLPECEIFEYEPYDTECCFVHLMQNLNETRTYGGAYPLSRATLEASGMQWQLAYDLTYLRNVNLHMNDETLSPRIRTKHATAWSLIRKRHKLLLDTLEANAFDPRSVADLDWTEPMRRVGTPDGFYG